MEIRDLDFTGFEGYGACCDGYIYSKRKPPYQWKIKKGFNEKNGYISATLSKNGKHKTFSAHKLVAIAFHGEPGGKMQVNHIDGVKSNNNADNLEWVTPSSNTIHALKTGLKKSKLDELKVLTVRTMAHNIPYRKIAPLMSVSPSVIYNTINGIAWKHINVYVDKHEIEAERVSHGFTIE